jgi:hypothetical protein
MKQIIKTDDIKVRGFHADLMLLDDLTYKRPWYSRLIRFILGRKDETKKFRKMCEARRNTSKIGVGLLCEKDAVSPVRKYFAFQEQMSVLSMIIENNEVAKDERVKELIRWYTNECASRPGTFKGQYIVLECITNAARTGLSFDLSLREAYRVLVHGFVIADLTSFTNNFNWRKL